MKRSVLLFAVLAGLLSASPAPSLDSPGAVEANRVFSAYIAARGRQDLGTLGALTDPGLRAVDSEGKPHPRNEDRLRNVLAWEGAMHAKWASRALTWDGRWLEAEASEENDLYDVLGVGASIIRHRIRVEHGQIVEWEGRGERSTGRPQPEALSEFKAWVGALAPELREGVVENGSLVLTARSAEKMRPLMARWRNEHPRSGNAPAGSAPAIVRRAIEALGGRDRLEALDEWVVAGEGRENLSAELQGESPSAPTWRPHEETIAVVRRSGAVGWERRTPRNDGSLRFRRFVESPEALGVVDWTTGSSYRDPVPVPEPARRALMRRVPHLLLLEAGEPWSTLAAAAGREVGGRPQDAVDVVFGDGARVTLLFDRATADLSRAESTADLPGLGRVVVAWTWEGWSPDARLGRRPAGHRIDVDGKTYQEVRYRRFEAAATDAREWAGLPAGKPSAAGARRDPPIPAAGPATGVLAPGVHAASIRGFVVYWVEFRDFVAVFDAAASVPGLESIPPSDQTDAFGVTEELARVVAKECPGKSVRYWIVSHHHGDHLGGLERLSLSGATILASPGDVESVRRALSANPRPGTPAPSIEAVGDRREIGDGDRRLEVIQVGKNPHTSENLFAWLPAERIVFEGDLFYYEEGSPFPPSGRETMNRFFARWLAEHALSPRAIYGVHGVGAAGPEALARALRP